ncbi:response regulator receiver modulated metal dependent phosphohydrolase [Solidesulfovibrio fructosivorans JJ]]|uniref:Response regulator receiver modulated metal dependent phosphohydrolase n=1 Tax=Solidesulfovibrio fructosivorans JJ] TaxID=596151 RepID=E1JYS6_SOLFR|nr:response regulator [Solidesulfovibrio fructosivorans]EFL50496.1 response regulator receiver modulated metal dependent phosphohydrolase [Solidesulfovibrio fructosivorans JJ]]
MRVINIIDIVFYRAFLSKLYLTAGIDYVFAFPEDGEVSQALGDPTPDAVLIQDSYINCDSVALIERIRETANAAGKIIPILCLRPFDAGSEDDVAVPLPPGQDIYPVNRINLTDVLREIQEKPRQSVSSRRSILFVDAGKTLLHVVRAALTPAGFRVVAAHNAEQALAFCRKHDFELVLTSVLLPGLSGLDLCRRIKEDNPGRYLPVIILSSSDSSLDMDTAFNCGADDYLLKAFTPEMLAAKVSEHLDLVERKRHNKILVADDNKLIRELLRHSFIKGGHCVLTAENGKSALELAKEHLPDVVVTDIEMPEMDGYTLCEKLRDEPDLRNTLVVMMSGRDRQSDILRGERLGISRYFVKPFDVEKMQLVVEQLLTESYRHIKKEHEHVLASMSALITALEARDEYTKGHTARVSRMAMRLGRAMELGDRDLRELEIAANLHDIGKIGVRDAVLLKPGKLTPEEYAKIQEHAIIGAEILRPIVSLTPVLPLILLHHERWDGHGYPTAIMGEDIPLGARIIAIADAFDAMTTDRPYRRGMPLAKALGIIEEEAGRQFCPMCAKAFLAMMHDGGDMQKSAVEVEFTK